MLNRDTLNAAASIVAAVRADVVANVIETANTLGGRSKHQLTVTFKADQVHTVSNIEHLITAVESVAKEGGRALTQAGIDVADIFMNARIEQQGQRGKPNSVVILARAGRGQKLTVVDAAPVTADLKAPAADKKPRTPRAPKAPAADKAPASDKKPRTPKAPAADKAPANGKAPAADKAPANGKAPAADKAPANGKAPVKRNTNKKAPAKA